MLGHNTDQTLSHFPLLFLNLFQSSVSICVHLSPFLLMIHLPSISHISQRVIHLSSFCRDHRLSISNLWPPVIQLFQTVSLMCIHFAILKLFWKKQQQLASQKICNLQTTALAFESLIEQGWKIIHYCLWSFCQYLPIILETQTLTLIEYTHHKNQPPKRSQNCQSWFFLTNSFLPTCIS